MDGVAEVAKKVRRVAERVLPGRPHHLTLNPNRKYAPPSGFWFTGQSSRLQYLTNLSDADRGMLLTVPFFEIMDEPETANPVKAVLQGEAKKKMSMKDYKARKKSLSPTDNDATAKADTKQAVPVDVSAAKEKDKSQEARPKETNGHPIVKPEKARPESNGERYVDFSSGAGMRKARRLTLAAMQNRITVQERSEEPDDTGHAEAAARC